MTESPRRRRSRVVAACALALLVVLAAPFLDSRVRMGARVRLLGFRLSSKDPMVRAEARKALLEIGRPAIDPVYPELIAGEVDEEAIGSRYAFVGKIESGLPSGFMIVERPPDGVTYSVVQELPGKSGNASTVLVSGKPVCPTAISLFRKGASPAILVVAQTGSEFGGGQPAVMFATLSLAVPLDENDPLSPEVIEAVKARLSERKRESPR